MMRRRRCGPPWTLQELRRRAYYAQRGLCYWCRQPMKLASENSREPALVTADHLVPVYAGGLTKPGNIVAACHRCNSKRTVEANMPPKREAVYQAGDDTPCSPFVCLLRDQA